MNKETRLIKVNIGKLRQTVTPRQQQRDQPRPQQHQNQLLAKGTIVMWDTQARQSQPQAEQPQAE